MPLTIQTSRVRGLKGMSIDVESPEGRKTLAETIKNQQKRGITILANGSRIRSYNQKTNEFTTQGGTHIPVTNQTVVNMIGQSAGG